MKTVTKVFLWINLITAIFAIIILSICFVAFLVAGAQQNESTMISGAIIFGICALIMIPVICYSGSTLKCLGRATKKSDISTARKVCGFIFGSILIGVLLCCIGDDDFEPEQPAVAQSKTSALDDLMKYKQLLDEGLITREEFDAQKAKLLK